MPGGALSHVTLVTSESLDSTRKVTAFLQSSEAQYSSLSAHSISSLKEEDINITFDYPINQCYVLPECKRFVLPGHHSRHCRCHKQPASDCAVCGANKSVNITTGRRRSNLA